MPVGERAVAWPRTLALLLLGLCGVQSELDNYYNWPDSEPPVVKAEVHMAGRETRVRCHVRERYRHIQQALNLTWEHKACRGGHSGACEDGGPWRPLCGSPRTLCPPILTIVDPTALDSGLYRCHITLEGSVITLNTYMLQFIEKRREPPKIVGGMEENVTVCAPLGAVLQCRVLSQVPPVVRWFRRLEPPRPYATPTTVNFIQYLNNTYQLLNCCPVAALSQKDLYLSKLVLSPSTPRDSGYYICLAINDINYTYRETFISVLPLLRNPVAGEKVETESFLGLFLIPASLALIPVTAWLLCLRPRASSKLQSAQQTPQTHTQTVTQTVVQSHDTPLMPTTIVLDSPASSPLKISQLQPN